MATQLETGDAGLEKAMEGARGVHSPKTTVLDRTAVIIAYSKTIIKEQCLTYYPFKKYVESEFFFFQFAVQA